jgi:hypothetical protein
LKAQLVEPEEAKSNSLRETLMYDGARAPTPLNEDSIKYIQSLDIMGKPFPILYNNDDKSGSLQNYVEDAVVRGIVAPLFFGFLTLLVAFVFCMGRQCFNAFGTRHATKHYHHKEINVFRAFFLVNAVMFCILFAVGLAANIDMSFAFDDLIKASDGVVECEFGSARAFARIVDFTYIHRYIHTYTHTRTQTHAHALDTFVISHHVPLTAYPPAPTYLPVTADIFEYKNSAASIRTLAATGILQISSLENLLNDNLPKPETVKVYDVAVGALYDTMYTPSTTTSPFGALHTRNLNVRNRVKACIDASSMSGCTNAATRTGVSDVLAQYDVIVPLVRATPQPAGTIYPLGDMFSAIERVNTSLFIVTPDTFGPFFDYNAVLTGFLGANEPATATSLAATKAALTDFQARIQPTGGNATYDFAVMNGTYTELLTQMTRFSLLGNGVFTLATADVNEVRSGLQLFTDFNTSIPDLTDAKARLLDVATDVKEGENTFDDFRADYYKERNSVRETIDEFDGLRLLWVNIFVATPMLMAIFGLLGCCFEKGCPPLMMALVFLPLVFANMLITSIQILPAAILADVCPAYHAEAAKQIADELVVDPTDPDSIAEYVPDLVSVNVKTIDLYNYNFQCAQGDATPEPLLYQQLTKTPAILAFNGFNMTEVRETFKNTSREDVALHPHLDRILDGMQALEPDIDAVAKTLRAQLVPCTVTYQVFDPFRVAMCEKFTGALCLSTCLYFLTALCMWPGIIFGIKGHKRMNHENHEIIQRKKVNWRQQEMERRALLKKKASPHTASGHASGKGTSSRAHVDRGNYDRSQPPING